MTACFRGGGVCGLDTTFRLIAPPLIILALLAGTASASTFFVKNTGTDSMRGYWRLDEPYLELESRPFDQVKAGDVACWKADSTRFSEIRRDTGPLTGQMAYLFEWMVGRNWGVCHVVAKTGPGYLMTRTGSLYDGEPVGDNLPVGKREYLGVWIGKRAE